VDVMSLSWGFPYDSPGIKKVEKALIKAHNQNIVILAAASNEGDLNEVAFPARLSDSVICIGAATGHGSIADFTTSDPKFQHYATLGIAVRGASLKGMWYRSNSTEIRSGTSTATPIAAGIAALLIDYASRNDCKLTKGHKGMLRLFAKLSHHKDTYRILAPQQLIKDPDTMKEIIEDALANGILRYEL
jgi:Subtilase family